MNLKYSVHNFVKSLIIVLLFIIVTICNGNPTNQLYKSLLPHSNSTTTALKSIDVEIVESFEKVGGSIEVNPFPKPTIVKLIRLEQVQIAPGLFQEMLANCLQVEGFLFKPYIDSSSSSSSGSNAANIVQDYKFDLTIINSMPGHHFEHFILQEVFVQFPVPPSSPINADLLVTFFESKLPSDFTSLMLTTFPYVNSLNLVQVQIVNEESGAVSGVGLHGSDLEFLLSGKITNLRHMYIRGFNWEDPKSGDKLRTIFTGLGCSGVRDYVFLDKDYDFWEC